MQKQRNRVADRTSPATAGTAQTAARPLLSVVIIGRNEGERLQRCLEAAATMRRKRFAVEMIYVDSASVDDSVERAAAMGARVIRLQSERPTAAAGRNAGWRAARGEYVLFVDGDAELHADFAALALQVMQRPEVAVVWGHRREKAPQQSWYVRVLDLDWVYAPGPSAFCGGDALMRRSVLEQSGGFDAGLIAGEEPELCRRIRACGHLIEHIDAPMTQHDLAITTFAAYWRRAVRAGHAYAEIALRCRGDDEPLWRAEARRNLAHGALLLAAGPLAVALVMAAPVAAAPMTVLVIAALGRSARRCAWKSDDVKTRWLYAIHAHLQQIPIFCGQIAFHLNRRRGRRRTLIEYKNYST